MNSNPNQKYAINIYIKERYSIVIKTSFVNKISAKQNGISLEKLIKEIHLIALNILH